MQNWLPLMAAAAGVLAAIGVWSYVGRRRMALRAEELAQALDQRTTELESARMELQRLSTKDPLTAVANHEQFLETLDREWRRARRERLPLSVIFVDLDHFQAYNREFGHAEGDRVLRSAGNALASTVSRAGDLVARYHRDEFAMVLASTDSAGAARVSELVRKCIQELQEPAAKDAPANVVTASVAVATVLPEQETPWEELDLIKAVSQALREARATGGNRVLRANLGMAGPPELVTR